MAWFTLIQSSIELITVLFTYGYLVRLAIKLQDVYRQIGVIKGYKSDIILLSIVMFMVYDKVASYILNSVIYFRIFTSEYECSLNIKIIAMVTYDIHCWVWPFASQLIFLLNLWQLFKV